VNPNGSRAGGSDSTAHVGGVGEEYAELGGRTLGMRPPGPVVLPPLRGRIRGSVNTTHARMALTEPWDVLLVPTRRRLTRFATPKIGET